VAVAFASIRTTFAMADATVLMDEMSDYAVSLLNSYFAAFNCSLSFVSTVNLSESMGMTGRGKLQVWNVTEQTWNAVCGENWLVPDQSEQVCRLLGYRFANETRLQDETYNYAKLRKAQSNRALIPVPRRINFAPNRSSNRHRQKGNDNQCRDTVTSVHIKCEQFGLFLMKIVKCNS